MKTFSRTSLPEEIKYNGHRFYCLGSMAEAMREHQPTGKYVFVKVEVLETILKGREDLHGKPYQPRAFLYGALKIND